MPQDFAKKKSAGGAKRSSKGKGGSSAPNPGRWFLAGLVCGILLSALVWVAAQQPEVTETVAAVSESVTSVAEHPAPVFDFYTELQEQSVEVQVDQAAVDANRKADVDQYLLQAGSFSLAADADRRRAELLLLGLDARVAQADSDGDQVFRVYVGPFETRSKLAKARSLTAQQGIDTLLLKRPQ